MVAIFWGGGGGGPSLHVACILPYAMITQFGCFNHRAVYLGYRQAEETVGFFSNCMHDTTEVPCPCVVTPVSVLFELVSTTQ